MAIQTNYCRCWYLIPAACIVAYAEAANITWLQWTVQPASYIGLPSKASRVPNSDVAAMCASERGEIIDPTVVDVTSQEFATFVLECFKSDIENSHFWVKGPEEEGFCSGIVLQRESIFETALLTCISQTRYLCYSTQYKRTVECSNGTITGESSTTETITDESSTTDTITGESSTTDTITGETTIISTTGADGDGTDIAVYAGAAAGGVVVLVVIIIITVCCTRRKNNHDKQRQPGDQEAPEVPKSTENKSDDTGITPIVPSYELVPNNFMPKPVEETEEQEAEREEEQEDEDVSPYAEYDGDAAVVDIPSVNNTPEKSPATDFKPGDKDKPPVIEPLYSDVRKNGAALGDAVVNEDKEKVTTPDADMYASVNKPKREASEGDLDDEETDDVVVDNPLYSSM